MLATPLLPSRLLSPLLMTVTLTACGGGTPDSGSTAPADGGKPGNGSTAAATQTAAPAPQPSPAPKPSPAPAPAPAPSPAPNPAPAPASEPAPAACDSLEKRLKSTTVVVAGNAAASDEYTPAVIAPRADGSAWLAWTDKTAQTIKMASLSPSDTLAATLPGVDGLEAHAMLSTPGGTALAVMANDPDIYSAKYCKSSATPKNSVCGKMDLVRLDANGSTLSRTTLTKKGNVDSVGAQYIWWYGHTARLATDGTAIGVYYRSAMSTQRPGVPAEVDIHAGDTLKFVDTASGSLLSGGWDWGCSHSWSVRLAHNGTQWAAACHGDTYPNAMRLSRLASRTAAANNVQWLAGSDPTRRALGGLVPTSGGQWINYVDALNGTLTLKLAKLPDNGSALTSTTTIAAATGIDSSYPFRPYMAAYGSGKLLLGWKSGGKLVLAVADANTGAVIEGPVSTALPIDPFQDMTSTPSGDVVWAYSPGGTSLRVQRVAACKLSAP